MRRLLLALVLLTWLAPATAHRASDAFVTLSRDGSEVKGSWEIALRDLEAAITIDRDRDRQITWGELSAARSQLEQRLPPFLTLATDGGPCTLRIDDLQVSQRVDGRYAWLGLAGDCPGNSGPLSVQYRFMFDIDPTHRAILALSDESGTVQTAVLSPSADRFPAGAGASGSAALVCAGASAALRRARFGLAATSAGASAGTSASTGTVSASGVASGAGSAASSDLGDALRRPRFFGAASTGVSASGSAAASAGACASALTNSPSSP